MKRQFLYMFVLLLPVVTGVFQPIHAQTNDPVAHKWKMDSLNALLNRTKEDTVRLKIYLALGAECDISDNLKYGEPAVKLSDKLLSRVSNENQRKRILQAKLDALHFCTVFYQTKVDSSNWMKCRTRELKIFKEIKDTANIIGALLEFGSVNRTLGNLPKALEYYQEGLAFSREMKDKKVPIRFLRRIADMYADQGDLTQALEFYKKCFVIAGEVDDKNFLASLNMLQGNLYRQMKNISAELTCYNKSLLLYKETKNMDGVTEVYRNIGDGYKENGDFDSALVNYKKSLSIAEKLSEKEYGQGRILYAVWVIYNRMGNTYRDKGDYKNALDYISRGMKLAEKYKDEGFMGWSYMSLAKIYRKQREFKKAKLYSDLTLSIMKKRIDVGDIKDAEGFAAGVDSACGNYKEAYFHYQEYIRLRDKLNSDAIRKAAAREKYQKEYNDQKASDKAAQDKKDMLAMAERKKQTIITLSVVAGLLIVLVFTGFVFRSLRVTKKQKGIIELQSKETERQKHVIEEKQKEIVDSIAYAKRLQNAILPSADEIKKYFPESFTFYQPKDIVAGDFYWMEHLDGMTFIAAADSTGHGVPGAMVSVVCSNALNRAVKEFGLRNTGDILDKTRELVIETFEKSDKNVKDGMDISLLRLAGNRVQWSGANNSLWYFQRGELSEIKANKQPIGKYNAPVPFTTHSIEFTSGTSFYLFSDGYADQFSENDKKLMTRKFKEVLLSIQQLPMEEQGKHLEKFHIEWKGSMEQTDDVLVIGIKV